MAATPQATPQFTGGGTVFGRNAAQWNQYFASKVDAEGGTADNLTVTGTLTVGGLALTPVTGVTVPLNLSNGTLSLDIPEALAALDQASMLLTATGVNFNSANTDTIIPIPPLPTGCTRYLIGSPARISGASASLTSATCGLFTGPGGTGVPIFTGQAGTVNTSVDGTVNNAQSITVGSSGQTSYTLAGFPNLYFRVQTPQGSPATANFIMTIIPVP